MQEIYNELIEKIAKERVLIYEKMSNHTTFKIGGPADILVKAKTVEEIQHVLEIAKTNNCKFTIIGNGSNILVKDKGIRGIVLKIDIDEVEIAETNITAGAGALLSKVCKRAEEQNLTGLEFAVRNSWNNRWSSFYECRSLWE